LQPNKQAASLQGPLRPGQLAPLFTLKDIEGQPVSLAALKGKPVLISFWATWCTPCRDELPRISAAARAHADQGLTVIAIDYGQESLQAVRAFWQQLGLSPAPVLDPDSHVSDAYGVGLKTTGLPVSVFVGRDGLVSAYASFALDADYLNEQLTKIL
jgi:cytochrome c biogenesis protein CcmG/thiol:disulfide interchange protein DsbE